MLRDYEQFPTTEGNVEARRRGPPGPRAALSASIADLGPSPFPMSIAIATTATHASLYIVRRSPAGPCRLEKTLSPAISSGRRRAAPMQIAAGPAIGSRCPLDHDRQRALFSKFFFFFSKIFQVTATAAPDLEFFSSAMRRFHGATGQSPRRCLTFALAVCAGESRCLRHRRAAVPSIMRDYRQFPMAEGNVEARRRTRPAWRVAVLACRSRCRPRSQAQQHASPCIKHDVRQLAPAGSKKL